MDLIRRVVIALAMIALAACAGTGGGLNSVTKTNRLLPGMSPQEVKKLLGDPASAQFVGEQLVWKYSLHENWKGFVPHYLVFAEEPPVLKRWFADEAEYQRQQAMWMQALQPALAATPAAAPAGNGARSGSSGQGGGDVEACKRRYRVYEDRMCYCYQVCR
jgi:hypothetical protein